MTTSTEVAPEAPPAHPSLGRLIVRRTVIALVLVLLILVPVVVLFVATKQPSATYAGMAVLIGAMAVAAGGVRIGVITAIVSALLAPLAIVAGLSPVTGAALMALMTLMVGRLSVFGLHRAVMLVPIFLVWPMLTPVPWIPKGLLATVNAKLAASGLTVTEALARAQAGSGASGGSSSTASATATKITQALVQQRMDTTYLTWIAVFFFVGAIVPVIVLPPLLKKLPHRPPVTHPRSEAVPYTITIAGLTTVATYYFLDHPKLVAGSFLVATVLVLAQVGNDVEWKITIQRVLGTLGGVLLLSAVLRALGPVTYAEVYGIPMPLQLYAVALVFAVAAIIAKFSPRQWIYYVLIAPAAAMLNAFTATQATDFGSQRLVDNVVGSVLVIAAAVITMVGTRIALGRPDAEPAPGTPAAPASPPVPPGPAA